MWGLIFLASAFASGGSCEKTTAGLAANTQGLEANEARLAGKAVIVVEKRAKRLALYSEGLLQDCWAIGLATDPASGAPPLGPKQARGDLKTPEGWYRTSDKPWSNYYKAIYIHYPNGADAAAGLARGALSVAEVTAIEESLARGKLPSQQTALGGELLIHGGGSSSDWTLGCIALDDAHIDSLRSKLPSEVKTDLLILP
jgi:murein L,D-transpeptidase YafK